MRCWSRKAPTWWPSIGSLAGITPHPSSGHCADRSGFIPRCGARLRGEVIRDFGGGRLTKESVINPDVSLDQIAKPGEAINAGDLLTRTHGSDRAPANAAHLRLQSAFEISRRRPKLGPLISEVITGKKNHR